MGLFGNWFTTKEAQDREQKDFESKIFPFGEKQKEIIRSLVNEIKDGEYLDMAVYYYLLTKQECEKTNFCEENFQSLYTSVHKIVKGKSQANIYKYIVLAKYDLNITEELNYPSAKQIIEEASQLENG